jgi:hypothetical protein
MQARPQKDTYVYELLLHRVRQAASQYAGLKAFVLLLRSLLLRLRWCTLEGRNDITHVSLALCLCCTTRNSPAAGLAFVVGCTPERMTGLGPCLLLSSKW